MVDLFRRLPEPLTHTMLFEWHAMLMKGRGLDDLAPNLGGERLRVTVPRGPIGVRIGRDTVEPPPLD